MKPRITGVREPWGWDWVVQLDAPPYCKDGETALWEGRFVDWEDAVACIAQYYEPVGPVEPEDWLPQLD